MSQMRSYRSVRYARSMPEQPTAAQVRTAELQMRQHLIAACDQAGYPVRGFLDTTVRRTGRMRPQARWVVTVTALIGHVC